MNDLPVCIQQEHLLLSREFFERRGEVLGSRAVPLILRLRGTLAHSQVECALRHIVRRHAALRASFVRAGVIDPPARDAELRSFATSGVFRPGLYRQVVFDDADLVLRYTNLSGPSQSESLAEVRRCIEMETAAADSDAPPRIRARLIKVSPEEHILLLYVDHMISDIWSMRLIQAEFTVLARGLAKGSPANLNAINLSYPDYAALQDQMINTGAFGESLDYWRQQWLALSDARIGYRDLPFSRPQTDRPLRAFSMESLAMDHDISHRTRASVRAARVTPYTFYLVVVGRLLGNLSGRDGVAVWGHFANRMRPEVQNAVGWFANTHLIGLETGLSSAVRDLLSRARQSVLGAAKHQELPVALVWRALGGYPNHPDAKILLDVETIRQSAHEAKLDELVIEHAEDLTPSFGRFSNLGFYVRDDGSSIRLSIQYSADRFAAPAMQQLLKDFRTEISAVINEL